MHSPAKPFTLTDEERDLVTNNHNLIYSYLNKYNLSDDYYDLCALGLCRAAHFYEPERGKFSSFAFLCMSNAISMEWRKVQRQVQTTVSLNSTICNEEPVPIPIECIIPDPRDDYASSELTLQITLIYKDDSIMQKVVPLYIKEYTAAAISRMLDIPVSTVRRRIAVFKKKLRNSLKIL